jgi:hypothetical protein
VLFWLPDLQPLVYGDSNGEENQGKKAAKAAEDQFEAVAKRLE